MATPKENISLGFAWVVGKLNELFGLMPINTSDLINDGEDTFSQFVQQDGLKTVNGNSLIGVGNLLVTADVFLDPYANSVAMIADQASQSEDIVLIVTDASDDTNITFAVGETNLQAFYKYNGVANGLISDYTLISVPYGNHTGSASEAGDSIFFLEDEADPDIAGYKVMDNPAQLLTEAYVTQATIVDEQIVQSWITDVGLPNTTFIPDGVWRFHINAHKTGGTKEVRLYNEVYKRNLAGTETLLGTTANSIILTDTEVALPAFNIYIPAVTLLTTDRIVTKTRMRLIGAGSDPTGVTIGYSGSTAARLAIPAQAGEGGIPDAPSDGSLYGRKDAGWEIVPSGGYIYNVIDYGALGDGIQHLDGAITATDATFTSASASFVAGDVGKIIHIQGAGASGAYHTTTIASINSPTSVEITAVAVTTVSGKIFVYGTENTQFIQDAINDCFINGGGTVFIPNGIYLLNGALQNNIGVDLIDYNSQIYIPFSQISEQILKTVTIKGESPPFVANGAGINTIQKVTLSGTCLLSTITGSGTDPSVICSKGLNSGTFADLMNITQSYFENLNILTTANENLKATVGGINCFRSVVSGFDKCTVFLYNIDLTDSTEPNLIDVTGISYSGVNATKLSFIRNCNVGGFTNGYKIGEHGTINSCGANCCVNAILLETNYHTTTILKFHADWCKYGLTFNGAASIHLVDLMCEHRSLGSWYDTVAIVNDVNNYAKGFINYNIVQASVGLNNALFSKIGGENLRCLPISFSLADFEVTGSTTDEKMTSLLNVLNRLGYIYYNGNPDLISYYRFNDDLIDQINSYNGTGTDITYVVGKSGNAANFNGTTSFISLGDQSAFSFTDGAGNDIPFSMSFYIKFDTVASAFIVQKRTAGGGNYEYQINYNGTSWGFGLYSTIVTNNLFGSHTHTPIAGTWYHIAVTYDGSETFAGMKMYINGASVALTNASAGSYTGMPNSASPLILGYRQETSSLFLDGALDGFAIKNIEMSAAQVLADYNTQNGGSELI